MLLKSKLQEHTKLHNIKWETIEQDYILSWVLEGISSINLLRNNLVFKGGTALKKMYFGDYRFSQDLDFSTLNIEKIEHILPELIGQACEIATNKIQDLGEYIEIISEPYNEKKPHPESQQAFTIKARMPWQRDFHTTVYAEISFQEIVILPPNVKDIIHPYGDNLTGKILVYPLEEIIAEKVRALLQFAKNFMRGDGLVHAYEIIMIFGELLKILKMKLILR